eukprot:6149107-Lingulodinium_polyedra.AAC.1
MFGPQIGGESGLFASTKQARRQSKRFVCAKQALLTTQKKVFCSRVVNTYARRLNETANARRLQSPKRTPASACPLE